jgi:predicted NBD/HSP70 family sugar kinase
MWKTLNRASQFLDEPNEYRILRLVRDSETISRTEIARLCKISKPTVSDIVNRFLTHGFLQSVGESESTARGGRKRELLRFNPNAGYVIGIDIRRTESAVAITDLNANIISSTTSGYPVRTSSEQVLSDIAAKIDALLSHKRGIVEKCVGIGIGLPGLIETSTGIVKLTDALRGWKGVNLRGYFQKHFDVPVYVDNNVKARAIAEMLFGAGRNKRDQIYLWIGEGIGVGIIINGKLHRGITESAGEIGYNELRFGSAGRELFPILFNGQRDFGEILSISVIVERYLKRARHIHDATIESILDKAARGDKLANKVIQEVALLTGILCINLINTLNPQLLVLGGRLVEHGTLVIDGVRERVRQDLLSAPAQAVEIAASHLRKDGVILGAVGLVLYDLFKPASIR